MNSSDDKHPDLAQLESFLESKLTTENEQMMITHFDTCGDCRESLESVAGGRDCWDDAKECLKDDGYGRLGSTDCLVDPDLVDQHLQQKLRHLLAPTDDPCMIGRIGTYEIAGVIGCGGTGIVLKAFDASLDRFVAIKVLVPELAITGAARERFKREARAAASVAHENVIPIHAVSESQGHSYIVMQYVPGHSLQQRIRQRGPLEVIEVLRISMHIARALASAHEQGLVHRDIKPANILLEEGIDRPIVTDFGLARVANDASLTNSGAIMGTPSYMSPEQADGRAIDARTDLFSLGSLMYAMCVGHPPFRAETIVGVLRRVCDAQPTSIREQNAGIPEWLEAFIFHLLSKNPEDRFNSAGEIADLLSAELAHLQSPTVHRAPKRLWWKRTHFWKSRKTLLSLVTVVSLLTAVGGVWGLIQNAGTSHPTPRQLDDGSEHAASPASTSLLEETESWDTTMLDAIAKSKRLENAWRSPDLTPSFDPWHEESRIVEQSLRQLESDVE